MVCYVWTNVLCDYTCGMIVVCAKSVSEAKEILKRKYPDIWLDAKDKEPIRLRNGDVVYVGGGG